MENVVDGRIDGRAVAEKTRDNVAAAVASLDITPTLAVVLVGACLKQPHKTKSSRLSAV